MSDGADGFEKSSSSDHCWRGSESVSAGVWRLPPRAGLHQHEREERPDRPLRTDDLRPGLCT